LRHYLSEHLPEYMLPAFIISVQEIPVTPNGKVDRRALPPPQQEEKSKKEYIAPRTPLEELLAGIWADVLGLPQVGVHDNFFDLGGHSLLAMRVVNSIRELLQRPVDMRLLLQSPTIEGCREVLCRGEDAPGVTERSAEVVVQVLRARQSA
jgi:hypothetical protein